MLRKLIIFTLLSLTSINALAEENEEENFWNWFSKNEAIIFTFESNQELVFDSISEQLQTYREGLVFEISHETNGVREFVISADGLNDLFDSVRSLTSTAPDYERWSIVAFRPRVDDYSNFKLNYMGKNFEPSRLWISYRTQDDNFDLIIYHPDYSEEEQDTFIAGTFILLDMALGEYDVVKGVRYIDFQKLPSDPDKIGLHRFTELRSIFDSNKKG